VVKFEICPDELLPLLCYRSGGKSGESDPEEELIGKKADNQKDKSKEEAQANKPALKNSY